MPKQQNELNHLHVEGVKCDNPDCDYEDMSVEWDDMELTIKTYLHKPCPKCGESLLTPEDVKTMRSLATLIDVSTEISKMIPESMRPEGWDKEITIHADLDGSGNCKLRREDEHETGQN